MKKYYYDYKTTLDTSYCAKWEWEEVKADEVKRWTKKGYNGVKCIRTKSDTKWLYSYAVVTDEEKRNG